MIQINDTAESIHALWVSFDEVTSTIDFIKTSDKVDHDTKSKASNLSLKMGSSDFIITLMVMKTITTKSKQITELLQAEDVNSVDVIVMIKSTIEGLCRVNKDEDGMNAEIQAGITFTSRVGGNANEEVKRKHRLQRKPRWLDQSPESEHSFDICTFYRNEFKAVLDLHIVECGENLSLCLQLVKPLAAVLQPPLKIRHLKTFIN